MDEDKNNNTQNQELVDMSSQPIFSEFYMQANETSKIAKTNPFEAHVGNDTLPKEETTISKPVQQNPFPTNPVEEKKDPVQPTFTNLGPVQNDTKIVPDAIVNPQPEQSISNSVMNPTTTPVPDSVTVPPINNQQMPPQKEGNPIFGVVLILFIIAFLVGAVAMHFSGGKVMEQDGVVENQPTDSKEINKGSVITPEEAEKNKKEEVQVPETYMNCDGNLSQEGITTSFHGEFVFRENNELFKVNATLTYTGASISEYSRIFKNYLSYGGYTQINISQDGKTISALGTKNTLTPSVMEYLGTLEKAQDYYKGMGVKCEVIEKESN